MYMYLWLVVMDVCARGTYFLVFLIVYHHKTLLYTCIVYVPYNVIVECFSLLLKLQDFVEIHLNYLNSYLNSFHF